MTNECIFCGALSVRDCRCGKKRVAGYNKNQNNRSQPMKIEKQIEVLARVEGIEGTLYPKEGLYVNGPFTGCLPDYKTHDDMQRLIDGLGVDSDLFEKYMSQLYRLCDGRFSLMLVASVEQKREAFIRAIGEWEE